MSENLHSAPTRRPEEEQHNRSAPARNGSTAYAMALAAALTIALPLEMLGSTVGFTPADAQIAPGEIISTTITGFDMQKLYAWQGKISYDTRIVKLLDVIPGTLLPEPSIFFADLDTPGSVVIAASATGTSEGASGTGEMAILRFVAQALGATTLDISEAQFLDPSLQSLPVNIEAGRVAVTPEPATFALIGSSLLLLGLLRHKPRALRWRPPRSGVLLLFSLVLVCSLPMLGAGFVDSITISPSVLTAGGSATATACLSFSQHSQPLNLGINNYHSAASTPGYVTIAPWQQCGSFTISTRDVQFTTDGQIGVYWIPDPSRSFAYANLSVRPRVSCIPPGITIEPQDQTVRPSEQATLSVTASGTAPLNYAWSLNGQPAGGNASTLTTPPLSSSATASVVVSNSCGSVRSRNATITVRVDCTPPSIASQPTSQVIRPGESASLAVQASGSLLQFQWYLNGAPIPGAILSTYTTPRQYGGAVYTVTVSNGCGSVSSLPAVISIGAPCPGPCTRAVQDIQVVARPLGYGPGDVNNLLGRHAYFLVTFTDGGRNTYGSYPDKTKTPPPLAPVEGKLQDPVDPPGGCGTESIPDTSVCLPLVLRPGHNFSEVISVLEDAVGAGDEGVYSVRSNNSNTWVRRRLDKMASLGIIQDVTLPASAVSNPQEFDRNIQTVAARLAGLQLPVALVSWILGLLF